MPFNYQPTLNGRLVQLRPMQLDDFDALCAAASDPEIWKQHPAKNRYQVEEFKAFFEDALLSKGALVAIDNTTQEIIGSSRFHGYSKAKDEVEIGWSFLVRSCWGGHYNSEIKSLMLKHAFQFVAHVVLLIGPSNIRSQKAAQKIGALEVGERIDGSGNKSLVYQISKPS